MGRKEKRKRRPLLDKSREGTRGGKNATPPAPTDQEKGGAEGGRESPRHYTSPSRSSRVIEAESEKKKENTPIDRHSHPGKSQRKKKGLSEILALSKVRLRPVGKKRLRKKRRRYPFHLPTIWITEETKPSTFFLFSLCHFSPRRREGSRKKKGRREPCAGVFGNRRRPRQKQERSR